MAAFHQASGEFCGSDSRGSLQRHLEYKRLELKRCSKRDHF